MVALSVVSSVVLIGSLSPILLALLVVVVVDGWLRCDDDLLQHDDDDDGFWYFHYYSLSICGAASTKYPCRQAYKHH